MLIHEREYYSELSSTRDSRVGYKLTQRKRGFLVFSQRKQKKDFAIQDDESQNPCSFSCVLCTLWFKAACIFAAKGAVLVAALNFSPALRVQAFFPALANASGFYFYVTLANATGYKNAYFQSIFSTLSRNA
jgi:hypothetical protein